MSPIRSTRGTTGWWACAYTDVPDPAAPWIPTLQWPGGNTRLEGVWFYSEDDCLDFIHNEVIGKGELEDQP